MDMCDIYFASFADRRYKGSLARIEQEARAMGVFHGIMCWNEDDLDDKFWEKHKQFILSSPRGFGFYIWKPQVLLQALRAIPEGAVLVFADAGCQLNSGGVQRLREYASMVKEHPSGIIGFNTTFPTKDWTKMDTMTYFNLTDDEQAYPQHLGGVHITHNMPHVRAFVEEWLMACERYSLIDDSPSRLQNAPSFKEHRHDQSIFTILFKRHGGLSLQDETWWAPHWESNLHYPIHARRLRH